MMMVEIDPEELEYLHARLVEVIETIGPGNPVRKESIGGGSIFVEVEAIRDAVEIGIAVIKKLDEKFA